MFNRIMMIFIMVSLISCTRKEQKAVNTDPGTQSEKIAYSLGVETGKKFKKQEYDLDLEYFKEGVRDGISDTVFRLSDAEMEDILKEYSKDTYEKMKSINKRNAANFLEENKLKEDITTTPSGLQYRIISEGYGIKPTINDTVVVHYQGFLLDGTLYDSSFERGKAQTFAMIDLIPGWRELLALMTEGDIYEAYIPPQLGYGDEGNKYINVPPNSLLHVKIELIEVQNKPH